MNQVKARAKSAPHAITTTDKCYLTLTAVGTENIWYSVKNIHSNGNRKEDIKTNIPK